MALYFRMKKINDSEENLNSDAGNVKRRHQAADWESAASSDQAPGESLPSQKSCLNTNTWRSGTTFHFIVALQFPRLGK